MSGSHADILRYSLERAQETTSRAALGNRMFELFFARFPETKPVFAQSDVESFGQVKFRLVSDFILDSVRNPDYALYTMASELIRHDYLDIKDLAYFYGMIDACQESVRQTQGTAFTPEFAEVWAESTQAAKATVQQAARKVRK